MSAGLRAFAVLLLAVCFSGLAAAQTDAESNAPSRGPDNRDQPRTVKEFLAKQRAERAKKDHEELLRRGDELIRLTGQLDQTFQKTNQLSAADQDKLEALEKLVDRIRKSLGGGKIDDEYAEMGEPLRQRTPGTLSEAFTDLKEMSSKLVDELKKTSRFTVSVVAIQSTNSVLKLVRFLRLRK